MAFLQKINELITENNLNLALTELNEFITANPNADDAYFMRGRIYWRLGDKQNAITDYNRAVELNPASPASRALENARDVMDFFNPDIFNP